MIGTIVVAVVLTGAMAGRQASVSETDVTVTLNRAASAYYDARYSESVSLLAPLDAALEGISERADERIRIKLQLALAYVGLNQLSEAKARFVEVYDLDPKIELDPTLFSPKVLSLADEVKTAKDTKCRALCRRRDSGNSEGSGSSKVAESGCSCASTPSSRKAAELIYGDALDAYKHGELSQALSKMRMVVKLNPEHDLAAQYVDLIQEKLKLAVESLALNWRAEFNGEDFAKASATYTQLRSPDLEDGADSALEHIKTEYRKALTATAKSWAEACEVRDRAAMETLRSHAAEVSPDASVAPDIMAKMASCATDVPDVVETVESSPAGVTPAAAASAPPPAPPPPAPTACVVTSSAIAMIRLKEKVDPEVPAATPAEGLKISASIRIDEQGNTVVRGLRGGTPDVNKAVVAAVRNWKFYPALVDSRARCVDTDVPILLNH